MQGAGSRQGRSTSRARTQSQVFGGKFPVTVQGNRISALSEEVGEKGVVPTGSFDFAAV
jgi:hypothetical protein